MEPNSWVTYVCSEPGNIKTLTSGTVDSSSEDLRSVSAFPAETVIISMAAQPKVLFLGLFWI